jgi:hypothetical protein
VSSPGESTESDERSIESEGKPGDNGERKEEDENEKNKPHRVRRPIASSKGTERSLPRLISQGPTYSDISSVYTVPTPSPPPPASTPPSPSSPRSAPERIRTEERVFKDYEERINHLLLQFRAASENGLFFMMSRRVDPGEMRYLSKQILETLMQAKKDLYAEELIECEQHLIEAETLYHDAIYKTSALWRLKNTYAFHLWIYFMGMIFSMVFFYIFVIGNPDISFVSSGGGSLLFGQFPLLAVQAVIWGMIGGLFQDIWYLWRHVQNRYYRNTWMIQYVSAPFIGGILGAIVYIIVIAGLIILDTDTEGVPRDFVVLGLAAFAGYNWDWAIKRFETIGARFQD